MTGIDAAERVRVAADQVADELASTYGRAAVSEQMCDEAGYYRLVTGLRGWDIEVEQIRVRPHGREHVFGGEREELRNG
jgi:hypothetical protein